jgi:hypothetical protein
MNGLPLVGYEKIRPSLKSGDLVLFDGKGKLSTLIKWFAGPFSHAGILVYSDDLDYLGLMESTTLQSAPDVETGQIESGVSFVALSERVRGYEGRVFVRQLNKPLDRIRLDALARFRREFHLRPYQKNKIDLVATLWRDYDGKEELASLFCSEVTAEALQQAFLLPEVGSGGQASDKYTPMDFSSMARPELRLCGGYEYGSEIEITYNKKGTP